MGQNQSQIDEHNRRERERYEHELANRLEAERLHHRKIQEAQEATAQAAAEEANKQREAELAHQRQLAEAAQAAAHEVTLQAEKQLDAEREHHRQLKEAQEAAAQAAAVQAEQQRVTELAHQRELAEAQAAAAAAAAELRVKEEAAAQREAELLAEKQKLESDYQSGIKPVIKPTKEQKEAAKRAIAYDPDNHHFAICGSSGSGKSSLINALRGIGPGHADAAKTGAVETTSEITRYPDPRKHTPYSKFVWYDIPGAGTPTVDDWQYFNDMGLFVFDFIVVVYDVRFTKIDAGLLENCRKFGIPVFLVRSKSDQHIRNAVDNDVPADEDGDEEDEETVYARVRANYIAETRANVEHNLKLLAEGKDELRGVEEQRVYIVNHNAVRALLAGTIPKRDKKNAVKGLIDEVALVKDMLCTAVIRRYRGKGGGVSEEVVRKAHQIASGVDVQLEDLLGLEKTLGSSSSEKGMRETETLKSTKLEKKLEDEADNAFHADVWG